MTADPRPVLLVTNLVAPDRAGAFQALHEQQGLHLALFGGRSHHATGPVEHLAIPHDHIAEREAYTLAASGRYRAVIAGTAGRTALPAAYLGARRSRTPFLLWTALWAHPRTPAFTVAGAPLLRFLYKNADAVITYGSHVSAFVAQRGAGNVHIAPQAVDATFWTAPAGDPQRPAGAEFVALNVGRAARYKGLPELERAWRETGFSAPAEQLTLVGDGTPIGARPPDQLRNFYAGADVLVMSAIATRDFLEPWGLVANEAMHQRLPVIATTAVGAAAGELVRHERNGLVVAAGDAAALAAALRRLRADRPLLERLGTQARDDAAAFTFAAWAAGVSEALVSVGAAQGRDR
ncbi:D-inositol-3-phosphate glycosyltransferase [Baekduia alba]|uniref:glycosyltransferase n=1 Tax=Baekduia alba TaxID=2997333 RepID=UPI0023422751|nr:glycosyltransferase [Baekduia alba]WCB96606.1 D-inositol-3-phosphate glycosyltransferase [Baekduia alba]